MKIRNTNNSEIVRNNNNKLFVLNFKKVIQNHKIDSKILKVIKTAITVFCEEQHATKLT